MQILLESRFSEFKYGYCDRASTPLILKTQKECSIGAKLGKKSESPIFKQILDLIPHLLLRASINKYKSDKNYFDYFTYDELVS